MLHWFESARSAQMMLYLTPSIFLALCLQAWILGMGKYRVSIVLLVGTFMHEFMHFVVGVLTGARPASFSILPSRQPNGTLQLGSVTFRNIRWYNAAFVGLAPLLMLGVVGLVAWVRTADEWMVEVRDLLWWFVCAQLLLGAWPSRTDWLLALRSWPFPATIVGAFYVGMILLR